MFGSKRKVLQEMEGTEPEDEERDVVLEPWPVFIQRSTHMVDSKMKELMLEDG